MVISRGMMLEAAGQCIKDRKELWRALVHMWIIKIQIAILAWFLCSFGLPSHALATYHLERGGIPLHDAFGVNC